MGITVLKKVEAKPQEALKVEIEQAISINPEDMDFEQLADLYGTLHDEVEAANANPVYTKFDIVHKALMSKINAELEATDTAEIKGDHWLLEVTACKKNSRKLKNLDLLRTLMGDDVFFKVAKVNISDVEKYLTPEQTVKVIEDDTGYSSTRGITAKYLG